MKSLLWLWIAISLFTSCSKIIDQIQLVKKVDKKSQVNTGFVEYNIRKGTHYAEGNIFKQISQQELRFQVIFDSSAIYMNFNPHNQYDINKLYGFSDCESMHHENSARFGWRWNGRAIEIHAYWYKDSIRHHQFLDTISIGLPHELAINVLPQQYEFEIKKSKRLFPRHCDSRLVNGYKLYPYFGGDEFAPHDMKVMIKEL